AFGGPTRGEPAARFSADAEMIRRRAIQQYHGSLCAGLFPPRERLWWHGQRAWPACSSPPPALRGSATDGACHGRSFKSSFATRSPRSLEQSSAVWNKSSAVWNKSSGVVILRHSLALPAPPPFG